MTEGRWFPAGPGGRRRLVRQTTPPEVLIPKGSRPPAQQRGTSYPGCRRQKGPASRPAPSAPRPPPLCAISFLISAFSIPAFHVRLPPCAHVPEGPATIAQPFKAGSGRRDHHKSRSDDRKTSRLAPPASRLALPASRPTAKQTPGKTAPRSLPHHQRTASAHSSPPPTHPPRPNLSEAGSS
jgi:hypothetical protein